MVEENDKKKLIGIKNRRLQKLREQEAAQGLNTPPEVLMQIEDLEEEIQHYDSKDSVAVESQPNFVQVSLNILTTEILSQDLIVPRSDLQNKVIHFLREERSSAFLIQGLPGYGKTILLSELVRALSDDFQYIFTVKFSGPFSIEPSYFLEQINEYLTQIGRGLEKEVLQSQNIQQSLSLLVDQISDLRLLVILDAVDDAPAGLIQPLLQSLIASNQTRLIMTAQSEIVDRTKARALTVPPLSDDESFRFIQHYANAIDGFTDDPQEVFDGLPANIKEHPQALSIFLLNLQYVDFEFLQAEDLDEAEFESGKLVENILASLDENSLSCLSFLVPFNDVDFKKSRKILGFLPPQGFVKSIGSLIAKSLVYRQKDAYRVPLIVSKALSKIAREIMDDAVSNVGAALESEINKLNSQTLSNRVDEVIPVIAGIFHNLYQMQYYQWVTKLATDKFLELVNLRGAWKEYWLMSRVAFDSAKKTRENSTLARIGFRISRKSFQVGDIEVGRQALAEVEKVIGVSGETLDNAELLSHKALFTELDGEHDKAISELLESLRIRQVLEDTTGIIIVEKLLGNLYLKEKNYDQARQKYEAALTYLKEMTTQSKELVEIETSLALCDLAEGDPKKAEARLLSAIKHCEDMGYIAGLPRAYYNLALALDGQGRFAEALAYAEQVSEYAINTDLSIVIAAGILKARLNNVLKKAEKEKHDGQ